MILKLSEASEPLRLKHGTKTAPLLLSKLTVMKRKLSLKQNLLVPSGTRLMSYEFPEEVPWAQRRTSECARKFLLRTALLNSWKVQQRWKADIELRMRLSLPGCFQDSRQLDLDSLFPRAPSLMTWLLLVILALVRTVDTDFSGHVA